MALREEAGTPAAASASSRSTSGNAAFESPQVSKAAGKKKVFSLLSYSLFLLRLLSLSRARKCSVTEEKGIQFSQVIVSAFISRQWPRGRQPEARRGRTDAPPDPSAACGRGSKLPLMMLPMLLIANNIWW